MIQWKTPASGDFLLLKEAAECSRSLGNDCCAVNLIFYSVKYGTQIAVQNGFLLRRFRKQDGTEVYCFPIPADSHTAAALEEGNTEQLLSVCRELFSDAEKNSVPFHFALLTDSQKETAERLFPRLFEFTETRESEDYIYLTENLANLPGKKFHKKKNHINQFSKKYESCRFEPVSDRNKNDALYIEEQWFSQNGGEGDSGKESERIIIKNILNNYDELELSGGILYADETPCAFCIAAEITKDVIDILFEKAIMPFAKDGAYAVINREFAKTAEKYTYINREEDLGIEGLRKAKLSYYPDIILQKWNGEKK